MGRQPEVVVRRQVHDLPMIERAPGLLLAFENPQMPVETLLFEGVEIGREECKRICSHYGHG
jgi:hypothetical protein